MQERLHQRWLMLAGSPRSCEDMIKQGRVTVNGTPAQLRSEGRSAQGIFSSTAKPISRGRAPLHHGLQTTRCPVIDEDELNEGRRTGALI